MNSSIYDLLMITSFDLDKLIEEYRLFFLALLPGMFILACLVEYFDRMNVFDLVKRALISVLILTSVTGFYKASIRYSIDAASEKFEQQKQANILLMDMFEAGKYLDVVGKQDNGKFFKNSSMIDGGLKFLKYHFFSSFVNDGFTISVYFISQLCFILLKVVYSLVYYLGYGLIGIPCMVYLFPSMGNVLRGGVLSFIWCLIVPHVLVFILSMIGSEINTGYQAGQVIGGSASGTILLFIMTLFIAFTPFITMMLINGSGIAQAGGVIALLGGNFIRSLPSKAINTGATIATGGVLGPKMALATGAMKFGAGATGKGFSAFKSSMSSLKGGKGAESIKTSSSANKSTGQFENHSKTTSSKSERSNQGTKTQTKGSSSNQSTQRQSKQEVNNVQKKSGPERAGKANQYRTRDSRNQKTNNVHSSSRDSRKHSNTKHTSSRPEQRRGKR
jgi:hypothetical protein